MTSNINNVHQAPATTPNQVPTKLTPEETSLFQGAKLVKTLVTTSLTLLALGSAVTGIVLAVVLASPAFLALMVVSVLFAVIACLAYKNLSLQASSEWQSELNNYFKPVPSAVAEWNFTGAAGSSIWQNRLKSRIYLALPENLSLGDDGPYSLKLPITYKTQSLTGASSKNTMTVSLVNPYTNQLDSDGTPVSKDLHAQLSALPRGKSDWDKALGGTPPHPRPFSALEIRATKLTSHEFLPPLEKKTYPTILAHARPPLLSDFVGSKSEVENQYYLRSQLVYQGLLEKAAEEQSDILSLPLLVLETLESLTAAGFSEQEVNDLSLSALISSVQKLAGSNQVVGRMLIIVQKKKTPSENED